MKKYILLFPVLVFYIAYSEVSGQNIYKEGFVITNENDTLHGLIRDCGTIKNASICFYKKDSNSKVVRYLPEDIKAYLIQEDKYFSSQNVFYKGRYQKVFIEVLLEGKFDLFYVRNSKNRSYFIKKDEGELKPLYVEDLFVNRTAEYSYVSERYDIRVSLYRDTLISLFDESEEIQSLVKNLPYEQKPLIGITKDYIEETCSGDDCIVFEKKFNKKHSFGFFTGVQFSGIQGVTNDISSSSGYSIPAGIFFNRVLSPVNERLSLQVELVRRSMNFNNGFSGLPDSVISRDLKLNLIGLPVLLKYRCSVNRFSPVVGFGKEFGYLTYSKVTDYDRISSLPDPYHTYSLYKSQRSGWFLELGADYKITQNISVFSNLKLQHHSNRVNRDRLLVSLPSGSNGEIKYSTYFAALHVGLKF